MVSDDVDVASQALGLLRANSITSLNPAVDTSNEAEIAALYYDDFVEDILTRHQWSFALKKALLIATTDPINEWRNAHTFPAEALRLWSLYASGEAGARPINGFDIGGQPGTRVINSNNDVLYAEYTIDVSEANWPGYFSHFAIHAFAALIAIPVTDDVDLAAKMHAIAWGPPSDGEQGGKFAVATSIDAQMQPPEEINDSPFIQARFS